jgi:AraC-like DNA-binding protein
MPKRGNTKGNTTRDVNAAQRAARALAFRAQKLTYDEIAQRCGYNDRAAAHKAVQRELQRTVVENVEELRREELAMLDMLHAECWKRLEDGEYGRAKLFAVDRLLAISERRSKLMGLDTRSEELLANQNYTKRIILQPGGTDEQHSND